MEMQERTWRYMWNRSGAFKDKIEQAGTIARDHTNQQEEQPTDTTRICTNQIAQTTDLVLSMDPMAEGVGMLQSKSSLEQLRLGNMVEFILRCTC